MMELEFGYPFTGPQQKSLAAFLAAQGLGYDEDIEFTVNLVENRQLIATGSLAGYVLKCLAVETGRQGQGLMALLVTELRKEAFARGQDQLLAFTKPANSLLFESLGFFPVAATADACLLESRRNGVTDFVRSLQGPLRGGRIGCIVANCDPFTRGHRYLTETAAAACDWLYLLILSEDRGLFSAGDRLALARENTADLPNVSVHPTGVYQVSRATFPEYFLRDKARAAEISCRLDLTIFARHFAPALGISRRFVGTEPLSLVTREYNEQMKAFLPGLGIAVEEIPRLEVKGGPVSASRVRALWRQGDLAELAPLVPEATRRFLRQTAAKQLSD